MQCGKTSPYDQSADPMPCPDAVAFILGISGLDASEVGDDWMDVLLMVIEVEMPGDTQDCHS